MTKPTTEEADAIKLFLINESKKPNFESDIKDVVDKINNRISDRDLFIDLFKLLANGNLNWDDIRDLEPFNDNTIRGVVNKIADNINMNNYTAFFDIFYNNITDIKSKNMNALILRVVEILLGDKKVSVSTKNSINYEDLLLRFDISSSRSRKNIFISENEVNMEYIKRFNLLENKEVFKNSIKDITELYKDYETELKYGNANIFMMMLISMMDITNKFLLSGEKFENNYVLKWILNSSFLIFDDDKLMNILISDLYLLKGKDDAHKAKSIDDLLIELMNIKFDEKFAISPFNMDMFNKETTNFLDVYLLYCCILPKVIFEKDPLLITKFEMKKMITFFDRLQTKLSLVRYDIINYAFKFNKQSIDMFKRGSLIIPMEFDDYFIPTN